MQPLNRLHVLVRELEVAWPPTALRPRVHKASLVDLLQTTENAAVQAAMMLNVAGAISTSENVA